MYTPSGLAAYTSFQITVVVMVLMLLLYGAGIFVRHQLKKDESQDGIGGVEASLLGLLALMLSFTFSMSSSRYDKRLSIAAQEANNIGTALLRTDLYPDSIRKVLRAEFGRYIAARADFVHSGIDLKRAFAALDSSNASQARIWATVTALGQDKDNFHRTSQMVPALNEMFDIVTTRNTANVAKVPDLVLYLLFLLCFTSAFILGYAGGKKRDWVITICFSIMISLAIYMILDLDRPRTGLITLKEVNYHLEALQESLR